MPGTAYSIKDIKADLPPVAVMYQGKKHIGHVRGRYNDFATVYIVDGPSAEFSWSAVQYAFNNGTALKMD